MIFALDVQNAMENRNAVVLMLDPATVGDAAAHCLCQSILRRKYEIANL